MSRLLEKLGHLLLGPELITNQADDKLELRQLEVNFITSRKLILKQLKLCRQSGGLLGVYSTSLGKGMFLTTVEELDEMDGDVTVTLKPIDMSGERLEKSSLILEEINAICPFNQMYFEPRERDAELRLVH